MGGAQTFRQRPNDYILYTHSHILITDSYLVQNFLMKQQQKFELCPQTLVIVNKVL